jgi:hypothetical protein
MKKITKRNLLFLLGCIPLRSYFVYLAAQKSTDKPLMGMLALLPAIGFLTIWMLGLRKTGGEVFGAPIWWNDLRPLHSALYFTFAYMAIRNNNMAYLPLLIDVVVGFIAFLINRTKVMNL